MIASAQLQREKEPTMVPVSFGRRLSERFLLGLGFRVTHCGWMQRGPVTVSGPPATSNLSQWNWHVDGEVLPRRFQPKTESQLMLLLAFVSD
jgi:hypothetical protein